MRRMGRLSFSCSPELIGRIRDASTGVNVSESKMEPPMAKA